MSVVSTSPNSSFPPAREPINLMCRYCAMQFDTEDDLSAHVLSHSRGAAPLKCTLCGQTYRTSSKLQRHIRVHSGEKPYICNICGRRFSRSDHLKQHAKVHSNHRTKNTCRICNARFVASHLLKSHLRSHGIKSVQTCETCGEAFETCIELEKHQKLHEVKQNTIGKVRRKNSLTPDDVSNGDTEPTPTEEPPVIEGAKWNGCARFCLASSQPAENDTTTYSIETIENSEKNWMEILGQLAEADYAEHSAAKKENLNETNPNCDLSEKSSTVHSTNLEDNSQMLETKEIDDQMNDSSAKSQSPLLTIQESANDDDDPVEEEAEEEEEEEDEDDDNENSEDIMKTSTIKREPGGDIEEEEEEEGGENDDEEGEEDIEPNCDEQSCDERMEVIEASEEFSDDESSTTNTGLKVCYSLVGSGEEFENIEAETITDGTKMFVVPSTSDFENIDQEDDISDSVRNGEVDFDSQQISYTISLVDKQPMESDQTTNNSTTGPFHIGNKKISNCKHCGIWFEDFAIYMLHNSLHLGNDDPFTCKKCLKKLGNRLEFMAHLMWHLEPPVSA